MRQKKWDKILVCFICSLEVSVNARLHRAEKGKDVEGAEARSVIRGITKKSCFWERF